MKPNQDSGRLDQATSARLERLAARPVDLTNLQSQLAATIVGDRENQNDRSPLASPWRAWWRPLAGIAAAVLIALTVSLFVIETSSTPAMAGPATLAQIHFDVVNGLAPSLTVSSVEEANRLLADQANGVVPVPDLPGVMKSCCLQQIDGATLTCALIEKDGLLITVAIADGAKLHSMHGKTLTRGNRTFIAHTANGINMVMFHHSDRWLCVMGEVEFEALADVAEKIRM